MLTMLGFSTVSACWVIVSECFISFYNLVAIFVCSVVTGFMSTVLGFSSIFYCLQRFLSLFFENKLWCSLTLLVSDTFFVYFSSKSFFLNFLSR